MFIAWSILDCLERYIQTMTDSFNKQTKISNPTMMMLLEYRYLGSQNGTRWRCISWPWVLSTLPDLVPLNLDELDALSLSLSFGNWPWFVRKLFPEQPFTPLPFLSLSLALVPPPPTWSKHSDPNLHSTPPHSHSPPNHTREHWEYQANRGTNKFRKIDNLDRLPLSLYSPMSRTFIQQTIAKKNLPKRVNTVVQLEVDSKRRKSLEGRKRKRSQLPNAHLSYLRAKTNNEATEKKKSTARLFFVIQPKKKKKSTRIKMKIKKSISALAVKKHPSRPPSSLFLALILTHSLSYIFTNLLDYSTNSLIWICFLFYKTTILFFFFCPSQLFLASRTESMGKCTSMETLILIANKQPAHQ